LEPSNRESLGMKILTWNICHGGGDQKSIASAISAQSPDVIVLSEHQTEKSQPLIEQLRFWGWPHVVSSPTEGRRNGVAILAREPIAPRPTPFGEAPFAWWGVEGHVEGLSIIGIYAPLAMSWGSSPEIQREFWNRVHRLVDARRNDRVLLIGDLNTCARGFDGPNPQPCWDAFEQLPSFGWVDAWRQANPNATDFSWVNRKVTPPTLWRIDHAFVSPLLAGNIQTCRYSHAEREAGLSDHSMLLVDIAPLGST
jgi:exodeoxyribonuclease-3